MKMRAHLIIYIVTVFCAFSNAWAEKKVELQLKVPFEPAKVLGLLISSKAPIEKNNPSVTKLPAGGFVVAFSYSDSEVQDDTVATALAISAEGEIAFADVRPLIYPDVDKAYLTMPSCAEEALGEPDPDVYQNIALLELLYETRSSRREVHRVQVEQLLTGQLLERLAKIEAGMGLSYEAPLSAALPPQTLLDRLQKIKHALGVLKGQG